MRRPDDITDRLVNAFVRAEQSSMAKQAAIADAIERGEEAEPRIIKYDREGAKSFFQRFPIHNSRYWQPASDDYRMPEGKTMVLRKEFAEQLEAEPLEDDDELFNY